LGRCRSVPAKIYLPMREYDAETLWKDFSAHLVYGLATAKTFPPTPP
jgi:hypothetical protein